MNSREVALNIINRVLIEGAYSNLVLSNELNESDLNEKDRALVTELVYGTIRRKKTLDMIISNYIKDNLFSCKSKEYTFPSPFKSSAI